MKLCEIKETLNCELIVGEDDQLHYEVECGCGADLMSDVLAFIKPRAVLLTGLTNAQVVNTAAIADIGGIVFVRGKRPSAEAIQAARQKGIPLMTTRLLMFEACGRLYQTGLKGGSEI